MSLKLRQKFHRPDPPRLPRHGVWSLPAAGDRGSVLGDSPSNRAASALGHRHRDTPQGRAADPRFRFRSMDWASMTGHAGRRPPVAGRAATESAVNLC